MQILTQKLITMAKVHNMIISNRQIENNALFISDVETYGMGYQALSQEKKEEVCEKSLSLLN